MAVVVLGVQILFRTALLCPALSRFAAQATRPHFGFKPPQPGAEPQEPLLVVVRVGAGTEMGNVAAARRGS